MGRITNSSDILWTGKFSPITFKEYIGDNLLRELILLGRDRKSPMSLDFFQSLTTLAVYAEIDLGRVWQKWDQFRVQSA